CHSSGVVRVNGADSARPALFTSTSTGPSAAVACVTPASIDAASPTSSVSASAVPPPAPIAAAVASASAPPRAATPPATLPPRPPAPAPPARPGPPARRPTPPHARAGGGGGAPPARRELGRPDAWREGLAHGVAQPCTRHHGAPRVLGLDTPRIAALGEGGRSA